MMTPCASAAQCQPAEISSVPDVDIDVISGYVSWFVLAMVTTGLVVSGMTLLIERQRQEVPSRFTQLLFRVSAAMIVLSGAFMFVSNTPDIPWTMILGIALGSIAAVAAVVAVVGLTWIVHRYDAHRKAAKAKAALVADQKERAALVTILRELSTADSDGARLDALWLENNLKLANYTCEAWE